MTPIRVGVVRAFPVWYHTPFFVRLAQRPEIDLTVLYLFDLGARGGRAVRIRDFDQDVKSDIDLLAGYKSKMVWGPVQADPARRWTMGGPGMLRQLTHNHFDVAVISGWEFPGEWLAYLTSMFQRLPFLLYTDQDVRDRGKTRFQSLRAAALRALCARAAGALYTGVLNRDFYIRHGVAPERLWFSPWAIDNDRFATGDRARGRARFGLEDDVVYFLFVGKFVPRKQPAMLMDAVTKLQREGARVGCIFAGSGALEGELANAIQTRGLAHCHLLGFTGQADLPDLYAAADAFVLPSRHDPRATVVNEAMAAGLPVVITTGTGLWAPGDLVQAGREGIVIRPSSLENLVHALRKLMEPDVRKAMGNAAAQRVRRWSYETAVDGWVAALAEVTREQDPSGPRLGPDSRLATKLVGA